MKPLSVCIPVKNRSRVDHQGRVWYPLPNCLRAIAHATRPQFSVEVVLADFLSDDWPLAEWVETVLRPVAARIITVEGDFSVGRGFNLAAAAATHDRLLFLGADMLVSRELIREGHAWLDKGVMYFPLVWSFTNPEHTQGYERKYGRGNIFMTKAMFAKVGPWNEFRSHGKSDDLIFTRAKRQLKTYCKLGKRFYHQWHPNDGAWKNRYYPKGWEADSTKKLKGLPPGGAVACQT